MEIPVYRLAEDAFTRKYNADLQAHVDSVVAGHPLSDELIAMVRGNFAKSYGCPWRYNQAVGWLRLLVLGSQIRADLWISSRKRLVRRGARDFGLSPGSHVFVQCYRHQTSDEIRSAVRLELQEFQRSYRNGRLHLDLECFDELAPHIDWRALVQTSPPS